MMRSLLLFILSLSVLLQAKGQESTNTSFKRESKVRSQFDYFNYTLGDKTVQFQNALKPDGKLEINMHFFNTWKRAKPERVWGAINQGLGILQDSLKDPLSQKVLIIALPPDSSNPLFRYKNIEPSTFDFVVKGKDVFTVKHSIDSVIVIEYHYSNPGIKDSTLNSLVYSLSINDLSKLRIDQDWIDSFNIRAAAREKKLNRSNFSSRTMAAVDLGLAGTLTGEVYPTIGFGVYYALSKSIGMGNNVGFVGYSANVGFANFQREQGLYLFHGLELGAFLNTATDNVGMGQRAGIQLGMAHIRPFELQGLSTGYKNAGYLGIHFPMGKVCHFSMDFASNFNFNKGAHVGYFGAKLGISLRVK